MKKTNTLQAAICLQRLATVFCAQKPTCNGL